MKRIVQIELIDKCDQGCCADIYFTNGTDTNCEGELATQLTPGQLVQYDDDTDTVRVLGADTLASDS